MIVRRFGMNFIRVRTLSLVRTSAELVLVLVLVSLRARVDG